MIKSNLKIEQVSINDVIPYWNNARNNKKGVKVVEKSIQKYGFNQPIAIDMNGEIIAGHTRYFAAINLGMTEVPCVRLDLTEEQCRQYRIADNKSHEFSVWDDEKLVRELRVLDDALELQDFFFEPIGEIMGFDPGSFGGNDGSQYEATASQEPVPESEKPTEKEIEKFKEKQEQVVERLSQEPTKYKDITCPHCGEIIRVRE